jgi:hypothetical protein
MDTTVEMSSYLAVNGEPNAVSHDKIGLTHFTHCITHLIWILDLRAM